MADSSVVVIEELTGGHRSIELHGPALPFRGAKWKSSLVMTTTWYPGNPAEATQQVLVPTLLPSDWEGMWRRTQMSRAPSVYTDDSGEHRIVEPHQLFLAMEALHTSAARLRVTWMTTLVGGRPFQIVREGRIKDLEIKVDTAHDIAWSATFEWMSRGGTIQKVVAVRDGAAADSVTVNAAVNDFLGKLGSARFLASNQHLHLSSNRFTLGQLEALASYPLKLVNSLKRTLQQQVGNLKRLGDIANTLRNEPFAIANTAVDFARNTVAICNQFQDQFSRTPVEKLTLKHNVADLTRAVSFFGLALEAQRVVGRRAYELEAQARQKLSANPGGPGESSRQSSARGKLLAVHVTRQGDTPSALSSRYYGTPDRALDILKANRLPWNQVSFARGTPLIIPQLDSQKRV